MKRIELFLSRPRQNVFSSADLLLASVFVSWTAPLFRMGNYHWVYAYGSLLGWLLFFLSLIFCFFNGILLFIDIAKGRMKYDLWLSLINFIPIFYLLYIAGVLSDMG